MIINMSEQASAAEIDHICDRVKECGFQAHISRGAERTIIGVIGSSVRRGEIEALRAAPGVEEIVPITYPFKMVSRQIKADRTVVEVGGLKIGGPGVIVMAGPCSVESREQLFTTARAVKAAGAHMLRAGAYKPRTSPYDFQGLGVEGLKLLKAAREETGLPVVTEVMSEADVDVVAEYADLVQIGARNMQNFSLLRRLATISRPVMLKRGPSATIKEWLLAAEYLVAGGNPNVVLCERGIKTFETEMRNTLDLVSVARARELSHLPLVVDPSHATGRRSLVPAASKAAIAIGADGLIIEVHPQPEHALSDGAQSMDLDGFANLMFYLNEPLRTVEGFNKISDSLGMSDIAYQAEACDLP
jgi:3-deoxy-7-phosphoheptulonate synthase